MKYQDDYFKLPKLFLTLSGSWRLETKHWKYQTLAWLAKTFYTIFRFTFIYLLTQLSILLSIATYFNVAKGFDDAFLAFLNVIIYLYNCFLFWFFYYMQSELDDFFKTMNQKMRHRSAPGLTYVSVEPGLGLARKVLGRWHMAVFMAAISYNFIPIVNQQRILPLPTWYPFDAYVSCYEVYFEIIATVI